MADKKAFQGAPAAVQVDPQPRPLVPPPYPGPEPAPGEVHYPEDDGKPMADDDWQMRTIAAHYDMLTRRFASDPNAFVAMALLLYYTEGEPADVVAPDVFVAFGVPDHDRDWWKVWAEGKAPDFVLEVASDETCADNLGRLKDLYARLGVREYCVYDPKGGRHWPRLQLFRLAGGVYERVPGEGSADGPLAVTSETLGMELRFEDDRLRLWDLRAGEYLLEFWELREQRLEERARRIAAERRIERSERRIERSEREAERFEQESARLRREKERLNRKTERLNRKTERLNRKTERLNRKTERLNRKTAQTLQRAEADALARQKAEAEIAVLKERLRRRS